MKQLLAGTLVMGYFVAGLFFLRYWVRTRDELFVYFATAFWTLALDRLLLGLISGSGEETAPYYLIRLFAFLLIIFAIGKKNWGRPGSPAVDLAEPGLEEK